MDRTQATSVDVQVPFDKDYEVTLSGKQIKFLLTLIESNHFSGKDVFLVTDVLRAIHKPLLDEADGTKT